MFESAVNFQRVLEPLKNRPHFIYCNRSKMHSGYQSVKGQSGIIQIEFGAYIRNAKLSLFIVIYQIRSTLLQFS